MKNYGFVPPVIDETQYVLGSSPLGQVVLQPDRNWLPFVPEFEPQQKRFETYNCTGFNTLNAIETLLLRLGIKENYSDRWLGIIAGTKAPGNDPHIVAEAIRKNGLIPESMLPYSDDLNGPDEYYSFKGADEVKCRAEGKKWLERFDFGHEWVFTGGDNKPEKMLEALSYSPLGVSVQAWKKDGALFTKPKGGQDNHWTCNVVGMVEKKYWIVDDSYLDDGQALKYLKWDYDFGYCKRYSIRIRDVKKEELNLFSQILQKLLQILGILKAQQPVIAPIEPQKPLEQPIVQEPPKYAWETPTKAKHSVRVICDEEGLTLEQKNTMCATIGGESGWNIKAKRENRRRDGALHSTDWGICQWNDYYHGKEISPDEAVNNPEKAVRLMCAYWKRGQRDLWIAYKNGSYKKYL